MAFLFQRIIPEEKLGALNNYSFSHAALTPLDRLLNHIWWIPIHKTVPRWIAPNVLTICGGLSVVLLNFLIFFNMPDLVSSDIPKWLPIAIAICIILYMTFDGIDGMQARSLGLSSPLGQLLDHGLDAMTTSFYPYFFLILTPNGYDFPIAFEVIVAQLNVLVINWREVQFGGFSYSSLPFTGVSEPMLGTIIALFVHYFHPGVFAKSASVLFSSCSFLQKLYGYVPYDLTILEFIEYLSVSCASSSIVTFLVQSYKQCKKKSTFYAHTTLPLIPLILPRDLHRPFCIFASSVGGIVSIDWVISAVSKTKSNFFHPQLVLHYTVILSLLLQHLGEALGVDMGYWTADPILLKNVLLYTTIFGFSYTFLKFSKTIYEIKAHLGIPIFTVPPQVYHAKKA
ncbi:ethanolaminephosphotransferase, putative [Theileria equi strain WA]|uniref:Ethanolaminephosphotransferase, putative n=1 Tax=Theileria equi strain WA TaxID=1537102 RepID=L1LG89_THEEQ|nr:ethanolaminephosphotransferase, putative [Theileria equi strain WA]EKX74255.1 ethanolaminephosphotransferase, putative [Theileria equi strain WA]|eukprot:XP_004833707.1 ethanolaminephosphotransferase, putative [Theileria equi strain WA]